MSSAVEFEDALISRLKNFGATAEASTGDAWRQLLLVAADWAEETLASGGINYVPGQPFPGSRQETANGQAKPPATKTHKPFLPKYPYYNFMPTLEGQLMVDGPEVSVVGRCHPDTSLKATTNKYGSITIKIRKGIEKKNLFCLDYYLFASASKVKIAEYYDNGNSTLMWRTADEAPDKAAAWDLKNKGIRIFQFQHSAPELAWNILSTVTLFVPEFPTGWLSKLPKFIKEYVPKFIAKINVNFLKNYVGLDMKPRNGSKEVDLDPNTIHSGDFFGIIKLDGLDPLLAWGMGAETGHTTLAIRDEKGELYIIESTAKDAYWPVNGIQMTPYDTWMTRASAAGYNIVYAPLSPKYSAMFNTTAALEFFKTVEGYDYGYDNLLMGWIDTAKDNYPCLPPDFQTCLTWPIFEVIITVADRIGRLLLPAISRVFVPALNQRLGTSGKTAAEILMMAGQQNIAADMIVPIPEQDKWLYDTTRYNKTSNKTVKTKGPSMVCDVFVCELWRAAGLFPGLDFECTELTNVDVYAWKVFDANRMGQNRPQACKDADPENQLCQLMGNWTLSLGSISGAFNKFEPESGMGEKCASIYPYKLNTNYQGTGGCPYTV